MRSGIQFAVGLVLVAILARVFLLMGLIVPVMVAGSSMAPMLIGPHVEAACPKCGSATKVGTDQPLGGWVACSSCAALLSIDDASVSAGDAIWIDRTAFVLRAPRRWEVVVFQCPDDASQLCVKRVLGLPGERIALRDGDIIINGQHMAKPFDIDYQVRSGDGIRQPEFDPSQQSWQLGEGYFVIGDNQAVSLDSRNWPSGPDLPPKLLVGRPIGHGGYPEKR
ncbi:MAG: signal peptidase I [Pirellulales bacterium]